MASRYREGRRRVNRAPGVWRGPLASPTDHPTVQHGVRERHYLGARLISGFIIVCLVGVLFILFSADIFYVHSIAVGGLQFMAKEEVFALADIANTHIFWVDPEQVRQSVLRSPTIADARVEVGWPPQMVTVIVEERQPALIWQQAGVTTWLDVQGRVMQLREDRPDLLRIDAVDAVEGPLGPNVSVDVDVVSGALQLHSLFPALTSLRYDPEKGLGYTDPRGWDAWFGTGTDMPEKVVVYDAIVNNLLARGIQPREVNVVNPHAPFYSVV